MTATLKAVAELRTCLVCGRRVENLIPRASVGCVYTMGCAYSFEYPAEQQWLCAPGTGCYQQRRGRVRTAGRRVRTNSRSESRTEVRSPRARATSQRG